MATRKETHQRRQAVLEELRLFCTDGSRAQGEMLPSLRDLAERYDVSQRIILEALQILTEEGLLYSVHRVGTFVGRPALDKPEYYLFTVPHGIANVDYFRQIRSGFEERVTALGGASLTLSHEEIVEYHREGDLPPLAGIFDLTNPHSAELSRLRDVFPPLQVGATHSIPYVQFGDPAITRQDSDEVQFDNTDGGRRATQHLQLNGHRKIAFLGLHTPTGDPGRYHWSLDRENGWKQVMEKAGLSVEGLSYHPHDPIPQIDDVPDSLPIQSQAARLASADLVKRTDVTAVVIANVASANGYLLALHEAGIAAENWPAVLCFDEFLDIFGSVMSYLRLPWSELGRVAAQLLWDRKHGRLTGSFVQRQVSMRLIARLSCSSNWTQSLGVAKSPTFSQVFLENPHPSFKPIGDQ